MAYDAYDRFIEAAKKFPRWTNIKRRPTESVGGKILRSIIEEIAAVEDAIIEYKKDFFIVNYIGREEDIADYLYYAQVGDIDDINEFELADPVFSVTDDEGDFYRDESKAYYKDGFVILWDTNTTNTLTYFYKKFEYTAKISPVSVWNIFDEFAWWCGLERFAGEKNRSLMQRCLYQFRRHPGSFEEGIRNAILNAASAKDDVIPGGESINRLEADEVKFIEPNEETLSQKNEDGITLYEEISRFNRDIARTRQWDIDYWDNAFRELRYLPHIWDAEMDICQDGVGYHDALHVTTINKTDQEGSTNVNIYGYVESQAEIEAYASQRNIHENISLSLQKYLDTIKPLPIQFKVTAEDLIPVEHPEQIYFYFYRQYTGERTYYLDEFAKTWQNTTRQRNSSVVANTSYRLKFSVEEQNSSRIEVSKCDLVTNNVRTSLLEEQPENGFIFSGNRIIHNGILFHGDKVLDFYKPENIEDCNDKNNGMRLIKPLLNGNFTVRLKNEAFSLDQQLSIKVDNNTGWNTLGNYHPYIQPHRFAYSPDSEAYISAQDNRLDDVFRINIPAGYCRRLKLTIGSFSDDAASSLIRINILRNGILADADIVDVLSREYEFFLEQEGADMAQPLTIEISRFNATQIYVKNIQVQSYNFEIFVTDGENIITTIPYSEKYQMIIPGNVENKYLSCTIKNNANANSPIINSVHIGPEFTDLEYVIDFNTTADGELEIETPCKVTLINLTMGTTVSNFDSHYNYRADQGVTGVIALDLNEFETIYYTDPALKKGVIDGEDTFFLSLSSGQSRQTIKICGVRYRQEIIKSLAEIVSLNQGETLYYARSANGFIKKGNNSTDIVTIQYDDISFGNRVDIITNQPAISACFITVNQASRITNSFSGAYESLYLFKEIAKEYIAYNSEKLTKNVTHNIKIQPNFLPIPETNALLWYRISPIKSLDGVEIYFGSDDNKRDWTTDLSDTITAVVNAYSSNAMANTEIFEAETEIVNSSVLLSNYIDLDRFTEALTFQIDLSRYCIMPPEGMEVVYEARSYKQTHDEDGDTLYVEDDGFNKLYHANISEITRIKVGTRIYQTSGEISNILSLLSEEGIICWNTNALNGQRIEQIDYNYYHPIALRFTDAGKLYERIGYNIPAKDSVNVSDYVVEKCVHGDSFEIDPLYFSETPTRIIAVCDNPYYYAIVSNNTVKVSRVAEEHTPVIHNGFYYKDGLEYYFFSKRYKEDLDRMQGVSIENGIIQENRLYVYQEAVNYLQNSRMDRNKLDVHCIVDFRRPRIQTNADPMGRIGACESFAAWEDYNVSRFLAAYKNEYAVQFVGQENGFSILDITKYVKNHKTISCLYSGNLTFMLAKEIRILNEQALKTTYCEPQFSFSKYRDVAYLTLDSFDTESYRYYLVVKGKGILDEISVHNDTEPEEIIGHHVKAIDVLGLVTTEREESSSRIISMDYTADFMRYNCLETDTDTSLRTGATVDWNITKQYSYDLENVRTTKMLYRGGALIAQADKATIDTKPFEIRYRKSIKMAAIKLNKLIDGVFKGFRIEVSASSIENGSYATIASADDTNIVTFPIEERTRYIKCQIIAKEGKIITDIDLLIQYKEVPEENLMIVDYREGSAVTKVFDIGAVGNYRFLDVVCENGFSDYDSIYIRGAKKAWNEEYVFSEWKNIESHPEFYDYELFQYKIRMSGSETKLRIKEFRFEVL